MRAVGVMPTIRINVAKDNTQSEGVIGWIGSGGTLPLQHSSQPSDAKADNISLATGLPCNQVRLEDEMKMEWQEEEEIMENLLIYREKKERHNITWEISYRKIQKKYIQYHFRFLPTHRCPLQVTIHLNHKHLNSTTYVCTCTLLLCIREKKKSGKFSNILYYFCSSSITTAAQCTHSILILFYIHTSVGVDLVRFLNLVPVDFPYTSISGPLRLRMFQT